MNGNNFSNHRFLTVSAINRYITHKFAVDEHLQEVYLEGEISNFRISSRHYYFILKDESSEIAATFFYPTNQTFRGILKDGEKVKVVGKIQTYEKKGTYSINVAYLEKSGLGLLYQQFLELKTRLNNEGLFSCIKNLPLPAYPKTIGVITAEHGDAVRDIISTFTLRYPLVKLVIFPSLVQGISAPNDLIKNLQRAYQYPNLDLIIIARGGGSFEDLSCFNDEVLARVIANSKIPICSAVGHEMDYTICDFVSTVRVPTPTAAAANLAPNIDELHRMLSSLDQRLMSAFQMSYNNKMHDLASMYQTLKQFNPQIILTNYQNECQKLTRLLNQNINSYLTLRSKTLENSISRISPFILIQKIEQYQGVVLHHKQLLQNNINSKFESNSNYLDNLTDKLIILNPMNLMKKGYSIVYQNTEIVSEVNQIKLDEELTIRMNDGNIIAIPQKIIEREEHENE